MRILITGGAGFIGSNLVVHFAARGHAITLFDNLSRRGVADNLEWILGQYPDAVRFVHGDVRDAAQVREAVAGCGAVFHLASQVAVTTSVADPRLDLEVNTLGTFNVLEAARSSSSMPAVLFASTNKVYGAMEDVAVTRDGRRYAYRDCPAGIDESRPLDFHSPYGCSKGAADQYSRDYHRIYGLPTVVFRMSCIYGPRQFGTEDQGGVAHFLISGLLGKPLTIYGDGMQVRDILYVEDLARLFEVALARLPVAAGQVYNVGGGPANSISLYYLYRIPGLYNLGCAMLPICMHRSWRWRVLDTFDLYSPIYQSYHAHYEVFRWFEEAGLDQIKVRAPGISIIGRRPIAGSSSGLKK